MDPIRWAVVASAALLAACAADYVAPTAGPRAQVFFTHEGEGAREPLVAICNPEAGEWEWIGRGPVGEFTVPAGRPLQLLYQGSFTADYRVFRCRDYVAEADLLPDRRYELRWRAGPEFYGRGACHLVITEVGAQPTAVPVDYVFTEDPACGLASAVETRH